MKKCNCLFRTIRTVAGEGPLYWYEYEVCERCNRVRYPGVRSFSIRDARDSAAIREVRELRQAGWVVLHETHAQVWRVSLISPEVLKPLTEIAA